MDNIQNEVDDFVESPNEKVEKRAKNKVLQNLRDKYPEIKDARLTGNLEDKEKIPISQEEFDKMYREQVAIARQEVLEEMKFEQAYKQQRYVGDIEEEQRRIDRYKANLDDEKLYQQGEISSKIYQAEAKLVQDEISSDFNVGEIVNHYRDLAERYNFKDEQEAKHIIEKAMKNTEQLLDTQALGSLIGDEDKREEFDSMVKEHGGKINIRDLLEQLKDNRIKTSSGYMENVARKDIDVRAQGLDEKTDTLKHFRDNSIVQEPFYEQEQDRLDARRKITIGEVEEATQDIKISDINKETLAIKKVVKEERESTKERE